MKRISFKERGPTAWGRSIGTVQTLFTPEEPFAGGTKTPVQGLMAI
jgi:hypothetical protein